MRPLSGAKSMALVISPLVSLMNKRNQVRFLKSEGISAEFISEEQRSEEARKRSNALSEESARSFSARLKRFCQAQDGDQC